MASKVGRTAERPGPPRQGDTPLASGLRDPNEVESGGGADWENLL
ncbi:hypothetical protein [Streptomyces sp. GC420]|nr:hypothetical protein [Streptomyces sp. GC420]